MRYTTPAIDKDIVESISKVLQEQVIPKGIELDEAAQVHTKEYSWGKLKMVRAGNAATVVLHPEHHKAIGDLKDGESHEFQDETRTKWKAARKGDDVHFTTDKISGKIVAKHAHIAEEVDLEEEVEQIDEAFFNHRTAGSHGIIHRDSAARFYKTGEHVDFYDHGTGDKQHGKVTKNDGKEVHILHAGKTKKYKLSNTYPGHGDEN